MATISTRYELAREQYAEWGVDTEAAMQALSRVPLSLHCWQGDDVGGFESTGSDLGGGLAVTGNYPGKARTADELRADLHQVLRLVPGKHRVALHACYGDFGGKKVDRDAVGPEHFQTWIDWAKQHQLGLDFNPTFFAHPKAADGWTLSHADEGIRKFWIEHGRACRHIAAAMGSALGTPCINNVWIPDGSKDTPVDRAAPRERLAAALDEMFADPLAPELTRDAVESKLFGIGSESYVVGSHEFYLGYAITRGKVLCLDMGHFHPTESVADKISSVMMYVDELLLHVSRGVRWDSDHVVVVNDDLSALAQALVRGNYLPRTHVGLDFFDASINRLAAWTIGCRATLKAILAALLEPIDKLRTAEATGDNTSRLALMEEAKSLPVGAVFDYYCQHHDTPPGGAWLDVVKNYERKVLAAR